jgi:hypothetical protein
VDTKMHLESMIVQVCRCNWRPRLGELRDTLRARDHASLEMYLEAEIE